MTRSIWVLPLTIWILWPAFAVGLLLLVVFADVIFSPHLANASVEFAFALPTDPLAIATSILWLLALLAYLLGPPILLTWIIRRRQREAMPTSIRES
ncbi:MAG: hypothetical protein IBJ03_10725 [Gemmatimonadaceae bacterium]|nr:hypothetical protein [Gemmatimonadaceae bacterium]